MNGLAFGGADHCTYDLKLVSFSHMENMPSSLIIQDLDKLIFMKEKINWGT